MAGGGGSIDSGEPEFQVAPMIDVLLVILIFFMTITSAQVLQVDKEIELPVAEHGKKKDETVSETYINVRWHPETQKSEIFYADKSYENPADIIPLLKGLIEQDPKYRAVIRGDRNLPALKISEAMDLCAQAGFAEVSFSALNRD